MFGTNAYAQAPFASAGGNAFFVSVSESAVAQDTVAAVSSLPTYAVNVFEATVAQDDAPVAGAVLTPSIAETAAARDEPSSIFIILAELIESVTAQDTLNTNTVFPAQLSEAAALADSARSNVNFQASLSESATGTALDFVAAQTFAVSVSESAFGLDALLSRELWEQIDDTQVADWTDILNPTTIEDIAVFGGANFGVVSFAGDLQQRYDPNPVVWNEIDDTQGTTWTDIVAV
jgi:hypothetical protein